ncbi:MAG TPA: hypothetical protein VGQ83_19905 [Polyangia bacterium]
MRAHLRALWHWRTAAGLAAGGTAGALYAVYVGCATGSCPLTSNPVIAALFGAILGATVLAPDRPRPAPPPPPGGVP